MWLGDGVGLGSIMGFRYLSQPTPGLVHDRHDLGMSSMEYGHNNERHALYFEESSA